MPNAPRPSNSLLVTPAQAAILLGVTQGTIRDLCQVGLLRTWRGPTGDGQRCTMRLKPPSGNRILICG